MGRSAYDFIPYATRDLRRYIESFELPKPADCHPSEILLTLPRAEELFKSHENRNLATGHEAWRKLEWITQIVLQKPGPHGPVATFLSVYIPRRFPLNKEINQTDKIYSLPRKLSDKFYTHKRCDIDEMKSWLALPLVTATRVMHNVFNESVPYVFSVTNVDPDDEARFQYLLWTPRFHDWGIIDRPPNGRLVFAFQTPFVLNEQDFREFIECTSLPPKDKPFNTMPGRYKLWAKIWDACYKNQCRWFVLTSYTHWVFGVFSESMRTASVTSIYRFDHASPTILELLVYWLASAMGEEAGFVPLDSYEPIQMEDVTVIPHVVDKRLTFPEEILRSLRTPKSVVSDYAWPGQNDKQYTDPNIDLRSAFEGEGSLHSHYPVQEKVDIKSDPAFKKWVTTSRNAKYRKLDEHDFVPINYNDIEVGEDDTFDPTMGRGEWMV